MQRLSLRALIDLLFPPHTDVLQSRAISKDALQQHITITYLAEHQTFTALPYASGTVRSVVKANKFYRDKTAALALGAVLGDILLAVSDEHQLILSSEQMVLVPMPTSRARLRERGGNQIEWVVNAAPQETVEGFEYLPNALTREHRESQSHLQKTERLHNVRGAFSVAEPNRVSGRCVVLVDDVIESGATMKDARRALMAAGAREVIGVALAR